jgi:hypothetical protein
MKTLTLEEVRAAWLTKKKEASPQSETLRGCTVEEVALVASGWLVRYRTVRGGPRTALLRSGEGVAPLRAGWYGTLRVAGGVILGAEEAA